MGYTHYVYRKPTLDTEAWSRYVSAIKKMYADPEVKKLIAEEYDAVDKPPIVDREIVKFNGLDQDGHETFYLERISRWPGDPREGGRSFQFCKTARKPYDKVVICALLAAKTAFGEDIVLRSDGDWDEWVEGRQLYRKIFGNEPPPDVLDQ
jgi:hypothetical protein